MFFGLDGFGHLTKQLIQSMIEILSHSNARELISLSGLFLESLESENSLPLGLVHTLAENPLYYGPDPALLLSVLDNGQPAGVAVMTPPKRIILSRLEASHEVCTAGIAAHLRSSDAPTPGVVGPAAEANAFVEAWSRETQKFSANISMRMRVFEIREVADVPLAPGFLRVASMADCDLMVEWVHRFGESIGEPTDLAKTKSSTVRYIQEQQLYIWEDGDPVSLAAKSRATRHGITINKVYTPPENRNKGYATSCVHALTRKLLSGQYSFCSLYTDLANPTSNSIYTKIGYRAVGDALAIDFDNSEQDHPG